MDEAENTSMMDCNYEVTLPTKKLKWVDDLREFSVPYLIKLKCK